VVLLGDVSSYVVGDRWLSWGLLVAKLAEIRKRCPCWGRWIAMGEMGGFVEGDGRLI
jgi:hypothetical protein